MSVIKMFKEDSLYHNIFIISINIQYLVVDIIVSCNKVFSTYNIGLESWGLRTLWRAGAVLLHLLLEGLGEAQPCAVAGDQGVLDEENLECVLT